MLRRIDNVRLTHRPGFFTGKGPVTLWIGKKGHLVWSKAHKDELAKWISQTTQYPTTFGRVEGRQYWLYKGQWHWDNDNLTGEQIHALLAAKEHRTQASINRAQSMFAMAQQPTATVRGAIPDDLKQYVWTRDQGNCRQCGSNVELQFDHIIPFALGGATSAENLQILCGPCNRRKGASVI